MVKIKIIAGSVRPGRFNTQPANWMLNIAKERKDIDVEMIDLQEVNLPFYDEPIPAMMHQYQHEHTKKWAEKIAEADGFIVVTPEYNHSYAPVIGNAFDFLNLEWNYKPISFISYGSAAGGSRAVEHLRGLVAEVRMFDLRDQLVLSNYYMNLDDKGQYKFDESNAATAKTMLDDMTFWAEALKADREKMHN